MAMLMATGANAISPRLKIFPINPQYGYTCDKLQLFQWRECMSDTLVVVSKVKAFVKKKSQMNTSASAMPAISKIVEEACEKAIESARKDGRKTVMDRDFE